VTDRPAARAARIGAGAVVVAAPLGLALTDPHLAPGPPALVVSTSAGALAVSALVLQPTFVARMALLSLVGLFVVVGLGLGRPRLRRWMSGWTWRVLHAFCAALVIVLGVGHAVLTDGALDGPGTPLLLGLGVLGLAALLAARARPAREPEVTRAPRAG